MFEEDRVDLWYREDVDNVIKFDTSYYPSQCGAMVLHEFTIRGTPDPAKFADWVARSAVNVACVQASAVVGSPLHALLMGGPWVYGKVYHNPNSGNYIQFFELKTRHNEL